MKKRVSLSLDSELLDRIDAAAEAVGATRSFAVSTLCRRGLGALASEGAADEAVSVLSHSPPPGALIIEVNLDAPIAHVAIAETIQEAAALARERGMRWAGCGRPHEIAGLTPPIDATAAICSTVAIASTLATAPKWQRCPPQIIRIGMTA
ncbi:MAG: hypothetical protein HIU90_01435 [Proteobacteria bacterium]|nr:hypothetical protein [Pseudomonadota bacterium]